jgi:hypothetical protein
MNTLSERPEIRDQFIYLNCAQIAECRHLALALYDCCTYVRICGPGMVCAVIPLQSQTHKRVGVVSTVAGGAILHKGLLSMSKHLRRLTMCGLSSKTAGQYPYHTSRERCSHVHANSLHNDTSSSLKGSLFSRFPEAANTALATMGAARVTPSSPRPPGSR